eukprot:scaffold642_cov81-Skeletonema_dohrnii-CCMP3373.AAC.2
MLLYYHGQLSWATTSCGLSYSDSELEIQYGSIVVWRPSQIGPHQVTYDDATTPIRQLRA